MDGCFFCFIMYSTTSSQISRITLAHIKNTHSPNGFRSIHLCSHMIECICWSKTSGKFAPVNIFITEVRSVWDVWIAKSGEEFVCVIWYTFGICVHAKVSNCLCTYFLCFISTDPVVTSWAKTLVHSSLIVDPTSVFWWHLVQAGLSDPARQAMHCAETSLCSKSLS